MYIEKGDNPTTGSLACGYQIISLQSQKSNITYGPLVSKCFNQRTPYGPLFNLPWPVQEKLALMDPDGPEVSNDYKQMKGLIYLLHA